MNHPDEGALRRLIDEPMLVPESVRRHIFQCAACRARLARIEADASNAARALTLDPVSVAPTTALAAVLRRVETSTGVPARAGLPRPAAWLRRTAATTAAAATAAALVVGGMTLTPAGALAQRFVTIFQPTQIQIVPVTTDQLRLLPNLRKYGTVSLPARASTQQFTNAVAAGHAARMTLVTPASLPAGVPTNPSYQVSPRLSGSFTFSAAKAQSYAARAHVKLSAMPAAVNGSTLSVTVEPVALTMYGNLRDGVPTLLIGQMRAPTVHSTGATVQQLENYVLGLPGVSPQLAAELRAINDPTTTLPLLIPVDRAHAHSVTVQGVPGLAVGDNTGIADAVVWERGGMVYGVAGAMAENQVLAIANALR